MAGGEIDRGKGPVKNCFDAPPNALRIPASVENRRAPAIDVRQQPSGRPNPRRVRGLSESVDYTDTRAGAAPSWGGLDAMHAESLPPS